MKINEKKIVCNEKKIIFAAIINQTNKKMTNLKDLEGVTLPSSSENLYLIKEYKVDGFHETRYYEKYWDGTKIVNYCVKKVGDDSPWRFLSEEAKNFLSEAKKNNVFLVLNDIIAYEQQKLNDKIEKRMLEAIECVSKYNDAKVPQKFGQKVVVLSGKHKGFEGVVFWQGNDRFKTTYKTNYFYADALIGVLESYEDLIVRVPKLLDVIGIRNADNNVVFVGKDKCKVIEGFVDAQVISREELISKENFLDINIGRIFA